MPNGPNLSPEDWDEEDFNENDLATLDDDTNLGMDSLLLEDTDREEDPEETQESDKPKKKRRRKLRYTEGTICNYVSRNNDMKLILHALYVHRRLTIKQIHRMYFRSQELVKISSLIRRLWNYGLLERKRIFAVAQTMADVRTYHYSLTTGGIRVYALVAMELEMLHEDPNLPKQHYWQKDLAIGSQVDHHFMIQNFLAETVGTLWEQGTYLPNGEWRRYLYSETGAEVPYRPDWVLFRPNAYFTRVALEGRYGKDILSVPVLTRNEEDRKILDEHYQPLISLECDMGTMRNKRLQIKCERIQECKSTIPKGIAILIGDGSLGEERLRWNESKTRVRNVGLAIQEILKDEIITDTFDILLGRLTVLSDASIRYIESDGRLIERFQGAQQLVAFSSGQIMTQDIWRKRKISSGLPDFTMENKGEITAYYFAIPGWLNPHVKVDALLQETGKDVHIRFVYLSKADLDADTHYAMSQRVRAICLDEWEAGQQQFYIRTVDRSGERWEVLT